ncbi:MAG: hypothetical protein QOJ64_739 [Acidobacteriota bacterium]|jgi:hypothetical protein|nr:hypothetical protein [Acidobacteriota bacterium]
MKEESNSQNETEFKKLNPALVVVIILSGIALLVLSAIVPEDVIYKRILEHVLSGIGDGLLVLGLIDLILRGYLQRLANRLTPSEEMLKKYEDFNRKAIARFEKTAKEDQLGFMQTDIALIRSDVNQAKTDIDSISKQLNVIGKKLEHLPDPGLKGGG